MNTTISEERLLVVSDVHMGNPLLRVGRSFRNLLRYALDHGYSICINGDGVDIMQMSLTRLTRELSDCFSVFRQFPGAGLRIYYVVGNHDIILEHFLQDWAGVHVLPFMNVHCGDKRVRVEHGHTYDRNFLRFPRIYTAVTVIGRFAISLSPRTYHALEEAMKQVVRLGQRMTHRADEDPARPRGGPGIPGELPMFRQGAEEVSLRGFDAVILGHTHREGQVQLASGATYYNTGFWMTRPWCVTLDRGNIWFGPLDHLPGWGASRVTKVSGIDIAPATAPGKVPAAPPIS